MIRMKNLPVFGSDINCKRKGQMVSDIKIINEC